MYPSSCEEAQVLSDITTEAVCSDSCIPFLLIYKNILLSWEHFQLQLPSDLLSDSVDTRWHSGTALLTEIDQSAVYVCVHTHVLAASSVQCVCTHTSLAVSAISGQTPTPSWLTHRFLSMCTELWLVIIIEGTHTQLMGVINCGGAHPRTDDITTSCSPTGSLWDTQGQYGACLHVGFATWPTPLIVFVALGSQLLRDVRQ